MPAGFGGEFARARFSRFGFSAGSVLAELGALILFDILFHTDNCALTGSLSAGAPAPRQLISITQDIAGDFCAASRARYRGMSARSVSAMVSSRFASSTGCLQRQALRGQRHLFGQQVRRRTSTGRHGQAIGHGVTGNFQRPRRYRQHRDATA